MRQVLRPFDPLKDQDMFERSLMTIDCGDSKMLVYSRDAGRVFATTNSGLPYSVMASPRAGSCAKPRSTI